MLRISHVSIIIALLNVPRSWLRVFAIRLVGSAMFYAMRILLIQPTEWHGDCVQHEALGKFHASLL